MPQRIFAPAALILAGLVADGHTRVTELKHLDRGYVNFHQKLAGLGADIERVNDEEAVHIENKEVVSDLNA